MRLLPLCTLVWAALAPLHPAAAAEPVKLATSARLDLLSTGTAGGLKQGAVTQGQGTVSRPNWQKAPAQARSYTVSFPLLRFATNELALQFQAEGAGPVTLSLMGPWEEASPGTIYRQEILWDTLEVTGAAIADDGWGKLYKPARSWHNQPLNLMLNVAANEPVSLRFRARPVIPEGFADMKRLGRNTAAHASVKRFQRGANLGNHLEAPPRQNWGAKYSAEDFVHLKAEGFDHVRLPIAWNHYAGPGSDFKLSDEIFARADFLVTNALRNGLGAIVNIHHFDDFTTDPAAQAAKFHALWRQIAAHYASSPAALAFELLNEPKDKATTAVINPIYADTIRQIRRTNPQRAIFVGPGKWNSIDELAALRLPDDDDNLIVTVHCYDPFYFTHQGASWTRPSTDTKGIVFPGPPATPLAPAPTVVSNLGVVNWIRDYNTQPTERNPSSPRAFRGKLHTARLWGEHYGRPIHVGEFGCYIGADPASRARFYAEFRRALHEEGLAWTIWDWKAGFRYWDEAKQQPAAGMREALFPPAKR